jgi:hypothetical protein
LIIFQPKSTLPHAFGPEKNRTGGFVKFWTLLPALFINYHSKFMLFSAPGLPQAFTKASLKKIQKRPQVSVEKGRTLSSWF